MPENTCFDAAEYAARLQRCVRALRERTAFTPSAVLVLGSGLGEVAGALEEECAFSYAELEGFPVSTVAGHEGRLLFGTLAGRRLAVMQGRVHVYEGYDVHDVVFPLRVLRLLGADTVFLTNAVGAVNEGFAPGDLVVVRDHIASFVPSPLTGENLDGLGERFPSMSSLYDPLLRESAVRLGRELSLPVREGVFVQTRGPQYETPAEVAMLRLLGADTVGMSTAVEAIAAGHMGMRVCALSYVTNMAAGLGDTPLSHEEVLQNAARAQKALTGLLTALIACA